MQTALFVSVHPALRLFSKTQAGSILDNFVQRIEPATPQLAKSVIKNYREQLANM
jgi:hypothetical protein